MNRSALVMMLILLSACGDAAREAPAPPPPAAPPPAAEAPASIRVDGLYRTDPVERGGSMQAHWLRFYANGRIIEATTGGDDRPEQVAAWFDWGHADARQRGRYEVADGHVRIETRSPAAHHLGHGTLERDGITVEWRDRTHDQNETRRFRFAPIRAWAAAAQ